MWGFTAPYMSFKSGDKLSKMQALQRWPGAYNRQSVVVAHRRDWKMASVFWPMAQATPSYYRTSQ